MQENDGVDLFDLVETLWAGKITVIAVAALSVLLTSAYIISTPPSYEAKLTYKPFITPPFVSEKNALRDFSKSFFSEKSFNEWSKTQERTVITFNDISDKVLLNGSLFMKLNHERLVALVQPVRVKFDPYVSVKSNDTEILQSIYSYAQHVNSHITKTYVARAREESAFINRERKMLKDGNGEAMLSELNYVRYIYNVDKGDNVLSIQQPTQPVKIWPKRLVLLLASGIGGLFAGIVIYLITAAYRKRSISKKHSLNQP